MKKLLILLNIILSCGILTAATFYCINNLVWLKWLMSAGIIIQAGLNLFYLFKTNKSKKWFGVCMAVALTLCTLASMFVGFTAVWSMILFVLAAMILFLALSCTSRLEWADFIFGACVSVPVIMLVLFGGILGFANPFIEVLVIVYLTIFSIVLGKSFSNLLNKRSADRSLQFVGSLLLFIGNFAMLCYNFSYVSHYILIVFMGLVVIAQILFLLSMVLASFGNEIEKVTLKEQAKKGKWGFVATALVMLFLTYSTAITFSNFNIATAKISKEEFLEMVGDNLNIPLIEINTQNNEFPTSKEDYVNASFEISNCENEEDNFSVEMADNYGDEGSVGIRLRGNSTMNAKKKPFRIKFDEKKSILGLKKNKNWVLLADYFDQSYIRNYAAFSLAKSFNNLNFTPSPNHVALILNGSFQGLYLLCEQVDENKGRTNVEEDFDVNEDTEFPFLVEMDNLAYKEGETGVDNFFVPDFFPVEIKYPEADERSATETGDKVYDYIYEYINAVFFTLKTGGKTEVSFRENPVGFEDLVDVASAVDYYLVAEIMHNPDATYKSIYFSKTKEGKMKFGPVWDYDYSMTSTFKLPYSESAIETANELYMAPNSRIFNILLRKESFYNAVKERYNTLSITLLNVADGLKSYKEKIDSVATIDAKIWHGKTGLFQYDMQYDYVRLYLQDRYTYLNEVFSKTHAEFISII